MANRSESTFHDVNRVWKLKEEKSELRSHSCSLKEQYVLASSPRERSSKTGPSANLEGFVFSVEEK